MTAKALVSAVLDGNGTSKDLSNDERKIAKKRTKEGVAAALNVLITSGKVSISEDGKATWAGKKRTVEDADDEVPKKKAKKSKKGVEERKKEKAKAKKLKREAAAVGAAAAATAGGAVPSTPAPAATTHAEPTTDEVAAASLANASESETQGLVEGDDGWVKPSPDLVTILLFYGYCKDQFNRNEQDEALAFCENILTENGVSGRLRLGREGFNGTLTGSYDGIRIFVAGLRSQWPV